MKSHIINIQQLSDEHKGILAMDADANKHLIYILNITPDATSIIFKVSGGGKETKSFECLNDAINDYNSRSEKEEV